MSKPLVLVTGGSGLVGQAIKHIIETTTDYSQYQFAFASTKTVDFRSMHETRMLFERVRPTYVIHLAARVGGLFKNLNEKLRMYEDNMDINHNVVRCCYEYCVEHSIHCLSTCVFPDKIEYPIQEEDLHNGPPHESNEGYAYAKRMLELHTRLYNTNARTIGAGAMTGAMTCVIPTNVYGPYDNFNLEDSHVIPGLIHRAYLAKRDGTDFVVKGSGTPLRQFIHSEDLARLILWNLFDYPRRGETMILAPNPEDEVSIKTVAEMIATALDIPECRVKFQTEFSDGQYKKTASNNRLRTMLLNYPDFKFKNIENGISSTIEWFINNYDKARK